MNFPKTIRRAGLVIAPLALVAFLVGCRQEGTTVTPVVSKDGEETIHLSDTETATILWERGRPVALKKTNGERIPFQQREAALEKRIVLAMPDGSIEVHRRPDVVNEDLDGLHHLYLKEASLAEVITDGGKGEPYIDPSDGAFCWTARTCTNPDCPSQTMGQGDRPYLFINRLPGVKKLSADRVDFTGVPAAALEAPPKCPVCGNSEYVEVYELPDVGERRQQLAKELGTVRSARDRARE